MEDDERTTISAEYQGDDIVVMSKDPLIGKLELMTETDEVVEVRIDRDTAEGLLSALVPFLAHGEGDEAPNFSTVQ
ncbi:hypothetical protein SAMN02927900_04843 [Rhizobium mongolense subsp. loessense]|uniref:Uncharacterized protein n=1 Tax=Rhizobium mongolense subsp. loessense TaxID=158890 RepID=A0A1G4T8F7_9HYPH|nr:hypothetical protein [Rhizobium mongolense]SCW77616.1 hypothetical protein SAMN02927900_04843 [Rhizobium mongolense subsp. loessense]